MLKFDVVLPVLHLPRRLCYLLQVKVRRRGSDTKYMAQVLAVGAECDIGESSSDDVAPLLQVTANAAAWYWCQCCIA